MEKCIVRCENSVSWGWWVRARVFIGQVPGGGSAATRDALLTMAGPCALSAANADCPYIIMGCA